MNKEILKEIVIHVLSYKRTSDGKYFSLIENDVFTCSCYTTYVDQKLSSIEGAYEDITNGVGCMFHISQEEVDEFIQLIKNSSDTSYCFHDWKLYEGVIHKDWYCTRCNDKKPWSWTEK